MRKLQILKTCIDLIYFFGIFTLIGMCIFVPMAIIGEAGFPIKVRGQEIEIADWGSKILLICILVSAIAFFYAILLIRRTLEFFRKRDIFNLQVIANFNKIGWCIVASALVTGIPMLIYNMIMRPKTGFEISAGLGMDSFMMSISLGLLFMVIAEAFKVARQLKEENELVI